jgi:hypothetical protein
MIASVNSLQRDATLFRDWAASRVIALFLFENDTNPGPLALIGDFTLVVWTQPFWRLLPGGVLEQDVGHGYDVVWTGQQFSRPGGDPADKVAYGFVVLDTADTGGKILWYERFASGPAVFHGGALAQELIVFPRRSYRSKYES